MSDLIERLKGQQKNAMQYHARYLLGGLPKDADVFEQNAITLGQAIERIEELEAALHLCDTYFNLKPSMSWDEAIAETAKRSIAKTEARKALKGQSND